ncbi:MAG: HAMP domain-containing sensor histidine kinase [Pseudomonadota bacterium]
MNASRRARYPTLARITAKWIALAAVLGFAIQAIFCLAENYLDEAYFANWYVKMETARIAEALAVAEVDSRSAALARLRHYSGPTASAYAFRAFDAEGRVFAQHNPSLLTEVSPFGQGNADLPLSWLTKTSAEWFHVAGGMQRAIGPGVGWIEVATVGDPDHQRLRALALDFYKDVWKPVAPTALFTALLAIAAVRRSLQPLERAAYLAQRINPTRPGMLFDTTGLPREAASFAFAINRLLARVRDMIEAQDHFIARAAHELRTPLAVMQLELAKIDHETARQLETDVSEMGDLVGRLLQIARMDTVASHEVREIDLRRIVKDVVDKLAPVAAARHCSITTRFDRGASFLGDLGAVTETVSNLVVNAIKHSPEGAKVMVTCGPGATLTVDDSGPGLPADRVDELFMPFRRGPTISDGAGLGLAIVQRAVKLHNGVIKAGRSELGGARFWIRFG